MSEIEGAPGDLPVRKRHRSTECAFVGQSKQYVHENRMNSQDEKKMREIYNKTVNLLFKGASQHYSQLVTGCLKDGINNSNAASSAINSVRLAEERERLKSVRLLGSGQFVPVNPVNEPNPMPSSPDRRCDCCTRKSRLHGICISCGQQLCEHCGFSCMDCNEPLCSSCVNLFDCGTAENPCCSKCQLFR